MTLLEDAEILEPEDRGIMVDDPKTDRSWESHPDAELMAIYDFGEDVSYDEFIAFLKRNADRLSMKTHSGQPDSIGVTDSRRRWVDDKGIERAFTTSGYQDTEYWIDPQWGQGFDAEPDAPMLLHAPE